MCLVFNLLPTGKFKVVLMVSDGLVWVMVHEKKFAFGGLCLVFSCGAQRQC